MTTNFDPVAYAAQRALKAHNVHGKLLDAVHAAALKDNAAYDAVKREQYKEIFGFVPRKQWTKAQRDRASGKRDVRE